MTTTDATAYNLFAEEALRAYALPLDAAVRLISLSENATFLVEDDRPLGVLRIYRSGYQSIAAMESELAWIEALRDAATIQTPAPVPTASGVLLHEVSVGGETRGCVMFEFVPGSELGDEDMTTFAMVGSIAARLHQHVLAWQRPAWFERFVWDLEAVLGPDARWGDWRNGPGHTAEGRQLLEQTEQQLWSRLGSYPLEPANSGLVHGDLRAANILQTETGDLWVIDFDDSGISWLLWDLCSTTTFIEHTPQVGDVVHAWLDGYTNVRNLTTRDLDVIPDLVFLRRLHILAWLGTHPESDLAHSLGLDYTHATYQVAKRYLDGTFLPRLRLP